MAAALAARLRAVQVETACLAILILMLRAHMCVVPWSGVAAAAACIAVIPSVITAGHWQQRGVSEPGVSSRACVAPRTADRSWRQVFRWAGQAGGAAWAAICRQRRPTAVRDRCLISRRV